MKPYAYRIKLGDTDAAGRLYFAAAFRIAHDSFEEDMNTIGMPIANMIKDAKIGLPVVHAEATYMAPLAIGDTVFVTTLVKKVGKSSISFLHEIKTASGDVAIKVQLIHVAVSPKTGKTVNLPARLRKILPH